MATSRPRRSRLVLLAAAGGLTGLLVMAVGGALLMLIFQTAAETGSCGAGGSAPDEAIALGPPGSGALAGATEYGGPGDPSSGTVGASGASLLLHPDSYAELGGLSFQTATMLGGLPYMTPLRVTWADHSAVAYKRDFGLGGGPIDGVPRVIDLWWQFAGQLGIPYQSGSWSGTVRVERPPPTGSAGVLQATPPDDSASPGISACAPTGLDGVTLSGGPRATLLGDGSATAPATAPLAVKQIIAAGNQIAGKPYIYGAAHGAPLSAIAPAYDCSSSVEHLLYGAGLLPVTYGGPSGDLESFGAPGPGRWVTLYASADHVFMYVAGLRWDTWNAAGPSDGSHGIGWHPLVRDAAGFVVRHPVGL